MPRPATDEGSRSPETETAAVGINRFLGIDRGTTSETAWVVGDWNGDGSDNPGILRGSWWLLRDTNSGGGATDRDFFFGLSTDTFRVWAK